MSFFCLRSLYYWMMPKPRADTAAIIRGRVPRGVARERATALERAKEERRGRSDLVACILAL